MADWRLRMAGAWRARCDRRARVSVLVLGDSHVRVFEHWWFMWALPHVRWHIHYASGGTAVGLPNTDSQTKARLLFEQALSQVPHDLVLLNLGEVDTGYNIWARAASRGLDPRQLMLGVVDHYIQFIERVAADHRLLVIGAPLPTLPDDFVASDDVGSTRKQVACSQAERTALTLAFNDEVAARCSALGIPHLDDRAASLGPDGVVRREWQHPGRHDHHYHRKAYAHWLARALRPFVNATPR